MSRPAVGDHLLVARDRVLVAKPGAPHVDAAGVHGQAVVEPRGAEVAHVRLEYEGLDPQIAKVLVPACVALEVGHTRDLEPHEVVRVVRDPLGVRLREPNADVC